MHSTTGITWTTCKPIQRPKRESEEVILTETNTSRMRILTFGAGALGTYIGGSLAVHGHEVVFLERPEVVEELRQRGLRLQLGEKEHTLPQPETASSLEEALRGAPFEVAIFALKSYDTASALDQILPHREVMPPILCLQNGVDNETLLAQALGPEKVIAGTVTSAIGRRAAGDIVLERLRGSGVAKEHPLAVQLVPAFNAAGLNARLYAHAADMKWSKMITNLVANACSAILDLPPGDIFAHPGLFHLEIRQLREALEVMAAQGIQIVDLPGTPVRALTLAVRRLPEKLARPLLKNAVGGGRGGKMPSFHIDLYSGRGKSEVDYLNGAVVRHGEQLGIPTPANRLLTETLLALTEGRLERSAFARKPEALLSQLPPNRAYSTTP